MACPLGAKTLRFSLRGGISRFSNADTSVFDVNQGGCRPVDGVGALPPAAETAGVIETKSIQAQDSKYMESEYLAELG